MASKIARGAALAATVVLVGGCGGPIQRDELDRGVQSLGATAAEGRLLALGVAHDRSKNTFVRVHARDLGDEADHEAEKLHDAEAIGAVARVKARAVTLAQAVSAALGDLQVAPGDRAVGRDVADRLGGLTTVAERLEAEL